VLEAVGLIASAQRRARQRTLVFVAVLVALVSGLSMALVAGAIRSGSVVDRFYARSIPADATVFDESSVITQDDVASLPGVRRVAPQTFVAFMAPQPGRRAPVFVNAAAIDFATADPTTRVLRGSLPRSDHPHDVVVNQVFVDQFHRTIGDVIALRTFASDQGEEVQNGTYEPRGPTYRFRIAGVVRVPQDIGIDEVRGVGAAADEGNLLGISNSFYEAHRGEFLNFGGEYYLGLAHPQSDAKQLQGALDALTPAGSDGPILIPVEDDSHRAALETPVRVETTALLALGIGIALAGSIALALILRTEQRIHDDDTPTLRSLGATARQLGGSAALRTLPATLIGTIAAIVLAIALSPLFPIGIGRELEFDGGVHVDALVLAAGALITLGVVILLTFAFALPRTRRAPITARHSAVASRLAAADAPIGMRLGAYLAFARAGARRSPPSRPVILGGVLLVALMTGLAVYGAGVDHAYASAGAHGWEWDAVVGNVNFPLRASTEDEILHDHAVVSATRANYGQASVNGTSTEFLAFDPHGDAPPVVTAGRLPRTAHEIALGPSMLETLHAHVGSTVRFSVRGGEFDVGNPTHTVDAKVVGRALPPVLGESDLGDTGIVTFDAVRAAGGNADARLVFVDLRTGRALEGIRTLDRRYTEEVHTDTVPARVVTLHRVRSVWRIGFALLAIMVAVLLGYLMAVTIRVRRHDFATLRTLGLHARQVTSSLTAQVGIVTVIVLAVGLPVGVLVGRWLWSVVTEPIGLVYGGSTIPALVAITALLAAAAAVAALVAARRVRHASIADTLRAP